MLVGKLIYRSQFLSDFNYLLWTYDFRWYAPRAYMHDLYMYDSVLLAASNGEATRKITNTNSRVFSFSLFSTETLCNFSIRSINILERIIVIHDVNDWKILCQWQFSLRDSKITIHHFPESAFAHRESVCNNF